MASSDAKAYSIFCGFFLNVFSIYAMLLTNLKYLNSKLKQLTSNLKKKHDMQIKITDMRIKTDD